MNKSRVFQILRFVALFAVATALYAGPIYNFTHGVASDVALAVPEIGYLVILGGVAAFIGGFRMSGVIAALAGGFIIFGAGPIATWLQGMARA
jgi:hypothetical protein